MKPELRELVGYLPYRTEVVNVGLNGKNSLTRQKYLDAIDISDYITGQISIKPILFPMSQIIEEITICGETFVPLMKLFELVAVNDYIATKLMIHDYSNFKFQADDDFYALNFLNQKGELALNFFYRNRSFGLYEAATDNDGFVSNQGELMDKLYSWGFDVHNLISSGLAFNKNSLV